jgi:magnesium transporter
MRILDRVDPEQIRAFHERGEFFWLDLEHPSPEDVDTLGALLGMPPLVVADTKEFGQRAKVDDYGDRLLIVFHTARGTSPDDWQLIEVHLHLSGRELVTVHGEPCPPLADVRALHLHTEHEIVYQALNALSECLFATMRRTRGEVAALEQRAFERPSDDDRRRITRWRGALFGVLQVVAPERDMLAENTEAFERVLGMEAGTARHPIYDVLDDLVLAANEIAYARELLAEAFNVYLQATSIRLTEIATRLSVLATIVVPLTLITSFFGQNFGWLVRHIASPEAFLVWGVGGMVVPTAVIWLWLRRAGYLNRDGQ